MMNRKILALGIGIVVAAVVVVLAGAWFAGYFDEAEEVSEPLPLAVETTPDTGQDAGDAAPQTGDAAAPAESQAGTT